MRKEKKTEENAYPRYAVAAGPPASVLPAYGDAASEQAAAPVKEEKGPGCLVTGITILFCMVLSFALVLLALLLFVHALNEKGVISGTGSVSGDWIANFFDSPLVLILGVAIVLITMLLIVLVNTRRARSSFLAIGCAAIVSAAICIAAAIFRTQILRVLPGDWQDTFVNATTVFRDYLVVFAIALILVGATCLSVFSCITAIKRRQA